MNALCPASCIEILFACPACMEIGVASMRYAKSYASLLFHTSLCLWMQTLMSAGKEVMTAVRSVSTLLDHTTATVSVALS